MGKRFLAVLITGLFFLCLAGPAGATLTTIGTATYSGSDYNLIWDDDNHGNSVVWLDYTNDAAPWSSQNAWATGLDGLLTYNIDSAYTVTWNTSWRLSSAGTSPAQGTNSLSELGHLYYDELGLSAWGGTAALLNAANFDNLVASTYWTETPSGSYHWAFDTAYGYLYAPADATNGYGLAIRSGTVSTGGDPVPEPATMLLFGTGLAGLAAFKRKRKGSHA